MTRSALADAISEYEAAVRARWPAASPEQETESVPNSVLWALLLARGLARNGYIARASRLLGVAQAGLVQLKLLPTDVLYKFSLTEPVNHLPPNVPALPATLSLGVACAGCQTDIAVMHRQMTMPASVELDAIALPNIDPTGRLLAAGKRFGVSMHVTYQVASCVFDYAAGSLGVTLASLWVPPVWDEDTFHILTALLREAGWSHAADAAGKRTFDWWKHHAQPGHNPPCVAAGAAAFDAFAGGDFDDDDFEDDDFEDAVMDAVEKVDQQEAAEAAAKKAKKKAAPKPPKPAKKKKESPDGEEGQAPPAGSPQG